MSENNIENDLNEMSFNELRVYCNKIVVENSDLKKQMIQMNKLFNLLNANKILNVFNDIINNANFGISLLQNFNQNKKLYKKKIKKDNNGSDGSVSEDSDRSEDESCDELPDRYLEQDFKECESNDEEWKPSKDRKKTNESKQLKSGKKREHIIYNPPERILKTVRIGDQEFECLMGSDDMYHCEWPDCGKAFGSRGNVMRHYTTHGAEKRYICHYPNCERKFAEKSSLNKHLLVHSGVKPFECDWPSCGYRCNDHSALKVHKRRHTGERPYPCDWPGCCLSFISSSRVNDHRRTHTGEKPFSCDWPGCTFQAGRNTEIKKHKRIHSGDKPLSCDWPECTFRTKTTCELRKHKIKHTGEKSYRCDAIGCDFITGYHSVLSKHKRRKHLNH